MMVTFVSQCEKKAHAKTRRVLDAFANRIGDNVWQTVVTEDGLIAVKKLLRKTATKNTAVSCHWIRSRSRSDLVWIVGNRRKFNNEGVVPVNKTQKNVSNSDWENNWTYLPSIKALVAVAALLHDWGKATALFQSKLKCNTRLGDPLRHEWISCLLLHAVVQQSGDAIDDEAWLNIFVGGEINEIELFETVKKNQSKPLHNLPPVARLVAWLIVTHHRLPAITDNESRKHYASNASPSIDKLLKPISAQWGYQNKHNEAEYNKRIEQCFSFPEGVLCQSKPWQAAVKKWAERLYSEKENLKTLVSNGSWRVALHHARLCLMLGDHYYSSLDANPKWGSSLPLYANTDKERQLKQRLDEHLVGVQDYALKTSQTLSRFASDMPVAHDIKTLKKKSPVEFAWQDKAVQAISAVKSGQPKECKPQGWFVVNMASTGCGKTIANAKIMQALSDRGESLRFTLALGLRTLTLQTGDEYRERIGLGTDELAVLIGSAVVQELHEKRKENNEVNDIDYDAMGSESMEALLDEELLFDGAPTADFLEAIIPKNKEAKNTAFLYAPVLVCTIDHMMAATETTRGGKYILPSLRLLSSDLVIDEVDDFGEKDLIAIGRLIHLAGMLGRKVMISSATIPPALAEGFFNAYQAGWCLHQQFMDASPQINCAWVDEFSTVIKPIASAVDDTPRKDYEQHHLSVISKRAEELKKQPIKRKGVITQCNELYESGDENQDKGSSGQQQQYFAHMQSAALALHEQHHMVDEATGKKVSFGVMRVANIPPCVALTQYLMQSDWPENFAPKIMAYHSRQVLLLRSVQEHHLDTVLKRKEPKGDTPKVFENAVIRQHLDHAAQENVLFILVATPVEEVGRDHDFDWAVIEPSSYRSIIQLAGRVRRHRTWAVEQPNIAVMQYNLKALRQNSQPAFTRPGYENKSTLKLDTHNMCELINESALNERIDALPRMIEPHPIRAKSQLADLEHQAMNNALKSYDKKGPEYLQGWINECWWMTALPQAFNRFRESSPDIQLYRIWQHGEYTFSEKDDKGIVLKNIFGDVAQQHNRFNVVDAPVMNKQERSRLWLKRDYEHALREECGYGKADDLNEKEKGLMCKKSQRYGEVRMPENESACWYSDDLGLWPKES